MFVLVSPTKLQHSISTAKLQFFSEIYKRFAQKIVQKFSRSSLGHQSMEYSKVKEMAILIKGLFLLERHIKSTTYIENINGVGNFCRVASRG